MSLSNIPSFNEDTQTTHQPDTPVGEDSSTSPFRSMIWAGIALLGVATVALIIKRVTNYFASMGASRSQQIMSADTIRSAAALNERTASLSNGIKPDMKVSSSTNLNQEANTIEQTRLAELEPEPLQQNGTEVEPGSDSMVESTASEQSSSVESRSESETTQQERQENTDSQPLNNPDIVDVVASNDSISTDGQSEAQQVDQNNGEEQSQSSDQNNHSNQSNEETVSPRREGVWVRQQNVANDLFKSSQLSTKNHDQSQLDDVTSEPSAPQSETSCSILESSRPRSVTPLAIANTTEQPEDSESLSEPNESLSVENIRVGVDELASEVSDAKGDAEQAEAKDATVLIPASSGKSNVTTKSNNSSSVEQLALSSETVIKNVNVDEGKVGKGALEEVKSSDSDDGAVMDDQAIAAFNPVGDEYVEDNAENNSAEFDSVQKKRRQPETLVSERGGTLEGGQLKNEVGPPISATETLVAEERGAVVDTTDEPDVGIEDIKQFYRDPLKTNKKFRIQKFLDINQKEKINLKSLIMNMVEAHSQGLKLLNAMQLRGVVSKDERNTIESSLKQTVLTEVTDYFSDSPKESKFIRKRAKKINQYIDRAFNEIRTIPASEAEALVKNAFELAMNRQAERLTGVADNETGELTFRDALADRLLSHQAETETGRVSAEIEHRAASYGEYGEKLYGGKFAGLERLRSMVGNKVPDFIGLEYAEMKQAVESQTLPPRLSEFLDQFKDQRNLRFMVRSSSVQEDKEGQSNAGCYETIGNVKPTEADMIDAIQQVYDSFNTSNAQAQAGLYGIGSDNTQHGAIVVQVMAGEVFGDESTISDSGVGLSPDPLSRAPGTFNLNAAHGHGELVVQGLGPTDQTLGVINSSTKEVHARTVVAVKPERMAPISADKLGLEMKDNPADMVYAPALTEAKIKDYAGILDDLEKVHPTGADMEFAAGFTVQQRSQDEVNVQGGHSYLSESYINTLGDLVHDVKVKSYGTYAVSALTPDQRLVADSLDNAFFGTYLNMQKQAQATGVPAQDIKAVFVSPPANPNSHAALMFRKEGISIVEVNDEQTLGLLQSSDQPMLLDTQRSKLINQTSVDAGDLTTGWFSYPAEAIYSMLGEKSEFTEAQQAKLAALIDSANRDSSLQDESTQALLKALKTEITKDADIDKPQAKLILAELIRRNGKLLGLAERSNNSSMNRVAFEMVVDITRLSTAIDDDGEMMHKLLYHNWIDAAMNQLPEDHQESVGLMSVKSVMREKKTNRSFSTWFSAVALRHAALEHRGEVTANDRDPKSLSSDARSAAKLLHRLSYSLTNQSQLKARWLASLSSYLRDNQVSEQQLIDLAKRGIEHMKTGSFPSMMADIALQSADGNLSIEAFLSADNQPSKDLGKMKRANKQLSHLAAQWSKPEGFQERLGALSQVKASVQGAIDQLNKDKPFEAIALVKEIETATEQLDLALKAIVTSNDYTDEIQRAEDFKVLLTELKTIATPLLEKAYRGSAFDEQLDHMPAWGTRYGFYQLFDQTLLGDQSLLPTPDFNVGQALITRAVGTQMTSAPGSLGDLHTLLHQNIRMALGQVTLDQDALRCLPAEVKNIHDQTFDKITQKLGHVSGLYMSNKLVVTSMSQTETGFQWQYAQPLRDHGLRISFDYDAQQKTMKVAIAMDGESENNRYEISSSMVEQARVSKPTLPNFETGRAIWPDGETSHENILGWTESVERNHEVLSDRVATIIHHVVETSFKLSHGTFVSIGGLYGTDEITREYPIYQMLSKSSKPNVRDLIASNDIKGLTNYLLPRLRPINSNRIGTATIPNNERIPLNNTITRKSLEKLILDEGLMDGRIGLYEFDKVLFANYSGKSLVKSIANNRPDVFWAMSMKQLEALHDAVHPGRGLLNLALFPSQDRLDRVLDLAQDLSEISNREGYGAVSLFKETLKLLDRNMNTGFSDATLKNMVKLIAGAGHSGKELKDLVKEVPATTINLLAANTSQLYNLGHNHMIELVRIKGRNNSPLFLERILDALPHLQTLAAVGNTGSVSQFATALTALSELEHQGMSREGLVNVAKRLGSAVDTPHLNAVMADLRRTNGIQTPDFRENSNGSLGNMINNASHFTDLNRLMGLTSFV